MSQNERRVRVRYPDETECLAHEDSVRHVRPLDGLADICDSLQGITSGLPSSRPRNVRSTTTKSARRVRRTVWWTSLWSGNSPAVLFGASSTRVTILLYPSPTLRKPNAPGFTRDSNARMPGRIVPARASQRYGEVQDALCGVMAASMSERAGLPSTPLGAPLVSHEVMIYRSMRQHAFSMGRA